MSRYSSLSDQQRNGAAAESSGSARSDISQRSGDVGDANGNRMSDKTGTGAGISFRKHRNPAGSSFRIESPGELRRSLHPPASAQSRQHGKRRSDDAEPKKQAHRQHNHRTKPSLGNSPLGKQVTNASPAEDGSRADSGGAPSPTIGSAGTASQGTDFDKDTAQLVNLALNLSESRRRASSGRTLTSPSLRERRVTSTNIPHSPAWDTQRQPKQRDYSWQFTSSANGDPNQTPVPSHEPTTPSPHLPQAAVSEGSESYEFSDATLVRAERARRHFELFEEYLRVLRYLPRLRVPGEGRNFSVPNRNDEDGRTYNPLQYIRNRKVRFRDRSALSTEGSSWENSEKVHNWVDNIISSQDNRQNHPEICLRLPPVDSGHHAEGSTGGMSPTSPTSGFARGSEAKKPRRPAKDWVISPSDLLADVVWLEDHANKGKIEDRNGNKIYPAETEFKIISAGGVVEPVEDTQPEEGDGQQDGGELQAHPPSTLVSAESSQNASRAGRGRRRQRFAHSLSLTPSHSHSRVSSRSRLRQALSKSSSTSSLDISDEAVRKKRLAEAHAETQDETGMFYSGLHPELDHPANPELPDASHPGSLDTDLSVGNQRDFTSPQSPRGYQNSRDSRLQSHGRAQSIGSSSLSDNNNRDGARRSSIEDIVTAPNSPTHAAKFPSIAMNLTPPQSRSASPSKNRHTSNLSRKKDEERSPESDVTSDHHSRDCDLPTFEHTPHDASPVRRRTAPHDRPRSFDFRRMDSLPTKLRKGASNQESKIRGMFKGGRIAELVGSEVSKVGDFIWKREPGHSRHSSSASSVKSETSRADEDGADGADGSVGKPGPGSRRGSLQPSDHDALQHDSQSVTNPPKDRVENLHSANVSENGQFHTSLERATRRDSIATPPNRSDGSPQPPEFGGKLTAGDHTSGVDKVAFRPTSRGLEPVAESPISGTFQRKPSRPRLSEATRNWSLSSHSITRVDRSSRISKRDIAAIRAHLLSSGTKALQIRRKCESPDGPRASNEAIEDLDIQPLNTMNPGEATAAARKLVASFDSDAATVRQSMSKLSREKVPSLISDLERLESLISSSLTPRMRKTNLEADQLTSELATTSTLSIKQLNDALDRGIRKRNRRFRQMSRLGFVLLEWCLVGVMWLVWMIVMVVKVTRGIWRGAVSGIRWILWL